MDRFFYAKGTDRKLTLTIARLDEAEEIISPAREGDATYRWRKLQRPFRVWEYSQDIVGISYISNNRVCASGHSMRWRFVDQPLDWRGDRACRCTAAASSEGPRDYCVGRSGREEGTRPRSRAPWSSA